MKNKIEDLNNHLFETIEMLKNNSDPKASPCEKIDLETAKRIADLGKTIIEGAKVQVQALELIAKASNPIAVQNAIKQTGVIDVEIKAIE